MSKILFVFSFFFFVGASSIYWLLNGDYDRYLSIIQGPYPLNYLGSTPVQLYFIYIPLILLAILFFVISLYIRGKK